MEAAVSDTFAVGAILKVARMTTCRRIIILTETLKLNFFFWIRESGV